VPDLPAFEHRDSRSLFVAYVPVGSIKAARALVDTDGAHAAYACALCHGPNLKGTGNVPRIAGRSPSYIVRQLHDMQSGDRSGPHAQPMAAIVSRLSAADVTAIAAYLATLD